MLRVFLACIVFMPLALGATGWGMDARTALFWPESKRFREIYGFGPYYQIHNWKTIYKRWQIWCEASYYQNSGHSIPLGEKTDIRIVPFSLGFSYVKPFFHVYEVYAGAGVSYTFMHTHDHTVISPQIVNSHGFGAVFKSGINKRHGCVRVGVFLDYVLQHYHYTSSGNVQRLNADISGFLLGGQIGIEF